MKKNVKILVLENDPRIRDIIQLYMALEGWLMEEAADWHEAVEKAGQSSYDLVIMEEETFFRETTNNNIPVKYAFSMPMLVLHPTNEQESIIEGFRLGADDCLAKPFAPIELICRIHALLRRQSPKSYFSMSMKIPYSYKWSLLRVVPAVHQMQLGDRIIPLTKREFSLISYMHRHMNRFISRSELLEQVWGEQQVGYYRTVDANIRRLRHKIQGIIPESGSLIQTVRGSGNCLLAPFTALK
ncbi:response regulator transcription factor [Paenibacillus sp. MMO-58]|uniref:response regulator transcription factor n=1 Tax=Paenibacillus sp. MMO-58 TaxID=3081290 RepID=UPI003017CEC5